MLGKEAGPKQAISTQAGSQVLNNPKLSSATKRNDEGMRDAHPRDEGKVGKVVRVQSNITEPSGLARLWP
jgi:hypothetical protein